MDDPLTDGLALSTTTGCALFLFGLSVGLVIAGACWMCIAASDNGQADPLLTSSATISDDEIEIVIELVRDALAGGGWTLCGDCYSRQLLQQLPFPVRSWEMRKTPAERAGSRESETKVSTGIIDPEQGTARPVQHRPGRAGQTRPGRLLTLLGLSGMFMLTTIFLFTRLPAMSYTASAAALSVQEEVGATATPPVSWTKSVPVVTASGNASHSLKRLNQLDCHQYASQAECALWAYSACSAAAITEVINSYGYHFRITEILRQELAAKAITPQLGLLDDQGIQRTAGRFGFTADWGYARSYEQVIATANAGTPVIVSWPPARYAGGHLVVVTGGDGTSVKLADSSRYNRTSLSHTQFMKWWAGFSVILRPGPFSFIGKPTLSASFINHVLASYHSPAVGLGEQFYTLGVTYGIDPAYALAFFMHESLFGTTGEARKTLSLGNERCISDRPCIDRDRGGYAQMESWEDGFDHWYRLILNGYIYGTVTIPLVSHPCVTIGQAVPVYAPGSDGNDVTGYIAALAHELQTWHAGQLRP